eukprot:PLAT6409.1.p2 GENE.PLAT6409.1~~PLAT6409.1.p2  ORF type:complete len:120 (-),score=24.83 PLAT6409.1:43-402(-)
MKDGNDDVEPVGLLGYDYRFDFVPAIEPRRDDCSVLTMRGHRVLHTLIRCHFSPERTTGERYIYTGSQCGAVYIFDSLTGERVALLRGHDHIVRDACWHPTQPQLVSASWDYSLILWEK